MDRLMQILRLVHWMKRYNTNSQFSSQLQNIEKTLSALENKIQQVELSEESESLEGPKRQFNVVSSVMPMKSVSQLSTSIITEQREKERRQTNTTLMNLYLRIPKLENNMT